MHRRIRERGGLLLEVVIGLSLFLTALLFSVSIFPNSAKARAQSRTHVLARAIARDYLEEEMSRGYGAYSTGNRLEIRRVTRDGITEDKEFVVVLTPTVLDSKSGGDPINRTHLKVTVRWNVGSDSEKEVFLETWVTQ